ncbi:peptidyl-tRNA hydrolase [Mycobacterium tuberculosis]|nr:peptidyl-tRNA hydrolase [Mycobacterium tuberculosis]
MAEPLLVVGLGNPGANYARTRHNLGFVVADLLAARLGAKFKAHKRSGAEVATGRSAGRSLVLAKPRCYMNESGPPDRAAGEVLLGGAGQHHRHPRRP